MFPFPDNATWKCHFQVGNLLLKIQTEMCFLKILRKIGGLPAASKSQLFQIEVGDPNALSWDLSPDGSRIAYAELTLRSASIHIRERGANTTRDIPLKGITELSTLAWSADGKSLFATTFALTGSSLFHVTLDGKYSVLYKGAKEVEAARPSPDGRYLAFGDVVSASNVWLVEGFPK